MALNEYNSYKKAGQVHIDEGLFEKIGEGDMDAFGRLYDITEKVLYAYLLGLAGNHHDAMDLMQETYLKVRAAAHLYKPTGKPMAWIFTIGKNLFLSHLRKSRRITGMDEESIENREGLSFVNRTEDRMVLESVLRILSEEDKKIVMMHAAGEMKHREIAKVLSMKLSTVLSRYNRAMKKLRSELKRKDFIYEK